MKTNDTLFHILKYFYLLVDLGFWLVVLSSIIGIIVLIKKFHKRKVIYGTLIGLFSMIVIAATYGSTYEQLNIKIRKEEIQISYLEEPLNLVLVSDLHIGRYLNTPKIPLLIKKINSLKEADAVLVIGDVVNETSLFLNHLDALNQIQKPVYFVYGNHDYKNAEPPVLKVDGLEEKLESINFNILENDYVKLIGPTYLYGIKDPWSEEVDFSKLDDLDQEDTVILMSHDPDGILELEETEYWDKVDLVVSGHTHGGEIRLPFIGSIWPIPTDLPREYDQNLHLYNDKPIYVTSGVGSCGVRMRFMNPSEIVYLTIK